MKAPEPSEKFEVSSSSIWLLPVILLAASGSFLGIMYVVGKISATLPH